MIHLSTIKLLREWARWGVANSIDYPSMSPMFGERALKTPLYGSGHTPDEVWRIEQIVCGLAFDQREVLIQRYQRHLSWEKIGERMGCGWRGAKSKTREAEDRVHQRFNDRTCVGVGSNLHSLSDSKAVTPGRAR